MYEVRELFCNKRFLTNEVLIDLIILKTFNFFREKYTFVDATKTISTQRIVFMDLQLISFKVGLSQFNL